MKFHKGLYRSICNISSLVNCWLATPDLNNDDSIKQLLADTLKMFYASVGVYFKWFVD